MASDRIEKRIELKAPVSRIRRALTDHQMKNIAAHAGGPR
jgi:hypothetical protein